MKYNISLSEYQKIVYERNVTAKEYRKDKTIHQVFEEQVERNPGLIALVYEEHQLSYAQLNELSNRLARYIREQQLKITGRPMQPDTPVALYMDRGLEMVISILAVLKAGGAYVPIDPSYPQQRIDFILDNAGAALLLTQRQIVEDSKSKLPEDRILFVDLTEELYSLGDSLNLESISFPGDLSYIIYTSGTTGKPKGVMVEHNHVLSLIIGNNFLDYEKANTVACVSNYAFDGSVFDIFFPLLNSKKLVVFDKQSVLDLSLLGDRFMKHKVDTVLLTTSLFNSMVVHQLKSLSSLKQVLVGGEACSARIVNSFKKHFSDISLINVYGPTETIVFATYCNLQNCDTENVVPIGGHLNDKKTYILDADLVPVPVGVDGELYIGGPGLARGYLNNNELTEQRFVANIFATDEDKAKGYTRLYKTGDIVRWLDDGNIEFVGRNDDQVKIRGFRIELAEIEHALSQTPGIRQSSVVVKVRQTESGDLKYLVGYYILDPNYVTKKDSVVLQSWENLYDSSVYQNDAEHVEITSDFSGWNSYITGETLPLHDMLAWRDDIVAILRKLNPDNVLEIGVGSGLLMYHLLDNVRRYTALDISQPVIDRHRKYLEGQNYRVDLYHLRADDIDKLPADEPYDTIIINSVCQYFPSSRYFEEILEKAINRLSQGGSIFIGDIRNYDLHRELIKEKLEFRKADYSKKDIDRIVLNENELLIKPAYFDTLPNRYNNISVQVLFRAGSYRNEISKYRYDVIITRQSNGLVDRCNLTRQDSAKYFNIPFLNQLSKKDILKHLSGVLPDYMVPSSLVAVESFPLTVNGKLDKGALPEPDFSSDEEYIAPASDPEVMICKIWEEVLGLDQVGISNDFFRIGGNSILAIRISHRMTSALGFAVNVADIFEYKTVQQLLLHCLGQSKSVIPTTDLKQAVLSFSQERLWFIEEYEGGTNAYHIPSAFELSDTTDIEGVKYALRQIVSRHEVLRSTIHSKDHEVVQVIHQRPLSVEEVVTDEGDAETLLKEDINRAFDLKKEYPIRVKFYRIGSGSNSRTILLVNIHHIASDGWSTEIFQRELFSYYQAYVRKDLSFSLPALEIQYKDYALWQRSFLSGETVDKQLKYWKERLNGYQALNLPTDYARPNRIDYRGSHQEFVINRQVSARLRNLSKQLGVTVHSALLSGISILLSKYSGQEDIVVGSPIANRHHRQTQDLIGFFVNMQINRTLLSRSQSYEDLIVEVHQQQVSAQLHQDLPFEKLVNELGVDRDLSRHPIFQVAFVTQSFGGDARIGEEQSRYLKPFKGKLSYEVEKFDLSVFMDDSGEEMSGHVSYATSLFSRSTISNLIKHYTFLLEELTNEPKKIYSQLSLLDQEEYGKIVYEWNNTDKVYRKDKTIHQVFEEQVERTPANIALVFEDRRLSYRELNDKSNQLARHIREQYEHRTGQSMKSDTLVALCMERSLEMVIGILAVLKAGGAYVPIDPSYPQERIDFMLQDTGAVLVISQRKLNGEVRLPEEKIVYANVSERLYNEYDNSNLPGYSTSIDLCYVIYTSGTTGKPKGVMIEHHQVLSFVIDNNFIDYEKVGTVAGISNYAFDGSVFDIFFSLLNGKKVIVFDSRSVLDLSLLDNRFIQHQVDTVFVTTALFNSLVIHRLKSLSSLKQLLFGGEACNKEIVNDFKRHFKNTSLVHVYGPTENIVYSTYCNLNSYGTERLAPIGVHLSDKKTYILDANLVPVPIGVVGELYVGGTGVARGYFNNEELTKQRFITDVFATEADKSKGYARLYKTGDLVRWLEDGNIEYIGRNDEQVKIRGYRIELAEIEHAMNQVAGIRQSCVVVREKTTKTGVIKYLVGYYVKDSEPQVDDSIIIQSLSRTLPDHMIPVALVCMDSFPLTVNGKLDKGALPDRDFTPQSYVPPRTNVESAVCGIWQEVLGVERVGITDDFFGIGGNSILAIRVSHRVSKALGLEVKVADVFKYRTVAELVIYSLGQPQTTIAATDLKQAVLSFSQERLWFIEEYEGGTNAYHIPSAFELSDTTDIEGVKYALRQIVSRHEVLRSTIHSKDHEVVQVIHQRPLSVEEVVTDEGDAETLLKEDINRAFDLKKEYPIRVKFYRIGSGSNSRTILLVNIHHIASDGWSTEIFQRELFSYYQAYVRKDLSFSLPALEIQYKDYALWQRSFLSGETVDKQLKYWKERLNGYQALNLPTDYARPNRIDYRGSHQEFVINRQVSARLRNLSKQLGVTVHSALLSGISILLSKYSGQEDIVVGSPIANRHHRQTQDLIGFFVNMQINRTLLSRSQSYEDLIVEVHQQQVSAQLHQDLPFEKLVNELGVDRDLSRHPIFQVAFVTQSFGGDARIGEEQSRYLKPFKGKLSYEVEKFDLSVFMDDSGEEMSGHVSYATSLFSRSTISNLIKHYTFLLEELTNEPKKIYSQLSLLDQEEYGKIVYEWNNTDKVYRKDKTIHQVFEEQVERTPANIALVFEDRRLSYRELNDKSNQLARHIREQYEHRTGQSMKSDTLVALCMERSLEMVIGILAVLKAGGAYVPIDPSYPQERIDYLLEDTDAALILIQRHLSAGNVQLPSSRTICIDLNEEDLYRIVDRSNLRGYGESMDLAYVIYTSGTTGRPKGVMVEHGNVVRLFKETDHQFGFNASDVWTLFHSYVFDFSVWELWGALLYGGKLLVISRDDAKDTSVFYRKCKDHEVSVLNQTPSAFYRFSETASEDLEGSGLSLRYIIFGGEALNIPQLATWWDFQERNKLTTSLINMYGITETTVHVTYKKLTKDEVVRSNIGRPLSDLKVYVLDRYHNVVPVGVIGELYVGGGGVARGYLNRADLTAERFIENPFCSESDKMNGYNRLYKSGDLVRRLEDGDLEYIGRNDDQLKIRGYRIELGEIEFAMNQVAAIKQSCVLARTRETESGTLQYLVGYYVPDKSNGDWTSLNEDLILNTMSKVLPDYMVPSSLVEMESFPLTTNGKLDKRALPEPEFKSFEKYGVQLHDLENKLTQIYAQVLGLAGDQIGLHDNFFRIGGNSILVIQLRNRLNQLKEFKHIGAADLFKYNTIHRLLENVSQSARTVYKLRDSSVQSNDHEVAIVGISGAFSGVNNVDEFWEIISTQKEGIQFHSKEECRQLGSNESLMEDPNFVPVMGKVKNIELFDPSFWGLSPNEAKQLDPQIRKFVEHCWFALESSGYARERRKHNIGVFAGSGDSSYLYDNVLHGEQSGEINTWEVGVSNSKDALSMKTAFMLDLTGPANSINTACSTGLVAVVEACKNLLLGVCDMALAGGVTLIMPNEVGYLYREGMVNSKDGHCRTFDQDASGTTEGSGVGVVLLKRLKDAVRDGDQILGVIKGYATNNDGARKTGYTAPSVIGQSECIINAQKMAGITSDQIEYIECHGTATHLGDPIEVQALREAFAYNRLEKAGFTHKTVLGAVKANIGHTDAAAGTAGLIKVCSMLRHNMMPGQVNFNTPNPELRLEGSDFEIIKENRDWLPVGGKQRLAGVSSFGVGGTNAHVIIGDYVPATQSSDNNTESIDESDGLEYIIPVSAKSRQSLEQYKQALVKTFEANPSTRLRDVAYTLQERRVHFNYRSAYNVRSINELIEKLRQDVSYSQADTKGDNKIVFMFPGQGVHYPQMAKALYDNAQPFRNTVDECIALTRPHLDVDLFNVIYPKEQSSQQQLLQTGLTQISLFIIEYSLAKYLELLGIKADAYIGHSVGEYVAATLSGVFTLEDAIKLVINRGRLMQTMVPGDMLAINAGKENVSAIVKRHNCEIAVINSEEDVVASGDAKSINALQAELQTSGISTVILTTSHAFHSRMMDEAAKEFKETFKDIRLNKPHKTFISNLSGQVADDEVTTSDYWCKQLRNTVQFAQGIITLSNNYNHKVSFIEVGPGKGLSFFVNKYKQKSNLQSLHTLQLLPSAKEAAGTYEYIRARLWMGGLMQSPNHAEALKRTKLILNIPAYQFNYQRCWIEKTPRQIERALNSIDDIFYERSWERIDLSSTASTTNELSNKNILVLINDEKVTSSSSRLLEILLGRSNKVRYAVHKLENNLSHGRSFDFNDEQQIEVLLNESVKEGSLDLVVYVSSSTDTAYPALDIISIRTLFEWALRSGQSIPRFISVSFDNYEVLGNEIKQEKPSIVHGITKSIEHEYFTLGTKAFHLDISSQEKDYENSLVAALEQNLSFSLIAVRNKYHWTPVYRHLKLSADNSTPGNPGTNVTTLLITGGLGAIGSACAKYFAQNENEITIVLIGRKEESNLRDDYRARLNDLRQTKHRIIYSAIDIGRADAVSKLIQLLKSNNIGGLDMILHSAGVGAKSALDNKTRQDIEQVVNPKIVGFENLVALAGSVRIKRLVNCSSLSSIIPSLGNLEYTAANLYLDESSFRNRPGVDAILTINLNQISDLGMAVEFIERGSGKAGISVNSIKSHEFPGILEKVISLKAKRNIILSTHSLNENEQTDVRNLTSQTDPVKKKNPVSVVGDGSTALQYQVAQIFGEVLGISEFSIHDDFFALGGNSIQVVQLKSKLNRLNEFKHIGAADLFKYTTVHKLVESISLGDGDIYKMQNTSAAIDNHEVAIVSTSGAFSGVNNVDEFWEIISTQKEGIQFHSKEECRQLGSNESLMEDPNFVPVMGKVKNIELFDPSFWGLSPNEAKQLDPQIRKFVEHCWFALESSGYARERRKHNIGVFAGSGYSSYLDDHILHGELAEEIDHWEATMSNVKDALATKAAFMLDLTGPANSINTACSTGLVAVVEACKNLLLGVCDMALAGGVTLIMPNEVGYLYREGMVNSKDGHCRTFDQDASGTTEGSGVGVVLLKRLKDAVRDGDQILGVIKGYATNNDGARKTGYTAPSVIGQSECIINAQKMAGITSDQIEYIECHGTATHLGDPIEVQALREAFAYNRLEKAGFTHKTVLGAVKANIGHTDAAAGTAGLIKVCSMLRHNMMPGQVNFNTPNPELRLEGSDFEIIKENRDWLPVGGKQRLAGVSSFGVGGTNAHVIIGDYVPATQSSDNNTESIDESDGLEYIIPVSAKSRQSLEQYKQALVKTFEANPSTRLRDVAYTLQERRVHFNYRSAYNVRSINELIEKLRQDVSYSQADTKGDNKIVFMFPGHGVHYPQMAKALYDNAQPFRNTVDECIALTRPHLDVDLFNVIYPGEQSSDYQLYEMRLAQISLFIIEYSLAKYLELLGIKADAYIGHSVGEYVAATLSGVFTLEDAIKLVINRGKLIQAMEAGGMLAINAGLEIVGTTITTHNCDIAAVNSAEDVIASGAEKDIIALQKALEKQGLPAVKIVVSVAGHSRMMDGTAREFKKAFDGIRLNHPSNKFISNLSGQVAGEEVTTSDYWCMQLRNTVQFVKGIDTLANYFDHKINFIEVGPGRGLSFFVNKYKNSNNYSSIRTLELLPSAKEASGPYKSTQAKLWMNGLIQSPNEAAFFKRAELDLRIPTYQFNFQKCWLERGKRTGSNERLQFLPNEKWLTTPIWSPLSNIKKDVRITPPFKNLLVFLREDQLHRFDFGLLAIDTRFVILDTNLKMAVNIDAGEPIRLNPARESDFKTLADHIRLKSLAVDSIIHAASIDNVTDIDQALFNSFYVLFLIRQYLCTSNQLENLLILTNGLTQITGEDHIHPANGTMVGAIRNINHEFLNVDGRIIDIGDGKNMIPGVAQLWNNNSYRRSDDLFAFKFGKFWVQTLKDVDELIADDPSIEDGDTLVVTGGLGNVGLAISECISRHRKVNLILISRHDIYKEEVPSDSTRKKLAAIDRIRQNGSSVEVQFADIFSVGEVERILTIAKELYGKITGVIHTAGVNPVEKDKYSLLTCKEALKGKVYGIDNIINALDKSSLKFIASTSSLASLLGDVNRLDYCAANSYLDYLSVDKKLEGVKIISTNWNAWQGEEIETGLTYRENDGIDAISNLNKLMTANGSSHKDNAELFYRLLNQGSYEQVAISRLDINKLRTELFKEDFPQSTSNDTILLEKDFSPAEYHVAQIFGEILGLEQISLHDDFFGIGGNSILAIRVSHRVSKALGLEVKVADVFKHRTVAELVIYSLGQPQTTIAATDLKQAVLSFSQERLWFIEEYEGGTNAYHIPSVFELSDTTDIEGVKYALRQIVSRHEVLRSTIHSKDHEVVQVIHQESLTIEEVVLTDEGDAETLLKEDINRAFDLKKEYPIRVKFYRIGSGSNSRTILLVNIHHIASDGWSTEIFQRELFSYYQAYVRKDLSFSLPALEIQYKDYALWQRSFLSGETVDKQLKYWKERLNGYQALNLPTDYARPNRIDYRGSHQEFVINRQVSARLRNLSKQLGVTVHSALLSGISILLSKYSGQEDIVVGSPIANRHHRQTQDLIGFFVNMQINRTLLSRSQSYEDLIVEVHQQQVSAQLHQDLPFEKLVNELGVDRDLSRHPIFQVAFVTQSFGGDARIGEEQSRYLKPFKGKLSYEVEKFDLSVFMDDSGEEMSGHVSYATSLFSRSTISNLIKHYTFLLEELTNEPKKIYSQLSLLDQEEYGKIVYEWNNTDKVYRKDKTIHQVFEEQVERTPANIALVFEDRRLSYRELNDKSNQLARHIREQYEHRTGQSMKSDTLVALCMERSLEMVIGILAVLKAGGAYVPIDPSYPQERIDFMLQDTGAVLVISQRKLNGEVRLPEEKIVYANVSERLYNEYDNSNLPGYSTSIDLCYVIYTSGTTGKPKGVMIEHHQVLSFVIDNNFIDYEKVGTVAGISNYAFDGSVFDIFFSLLNGKKVIVFDSRSVLDLSLLDNRFIQHQVDTVFVTTALFNSLVIHRLKSLSSLKQLLFGGEACNKEIVNDFKRHFKNTSLVHVYGPTENIVYSTYCNLNSYGTERLAPIGVHLSDKKTYILDANLVPVPIGVVGELYVGGAGVARGYFNNEELTKQRFITDVFATEADKSKGYARLYKTGDLVRWLEDGNIEYIGRNDEQVKIRGYRIELAEIEHAMNQVAGIRQSCVVVREKTTKTGVIKYLVGYYIPELTNQRTPLTDASVLNSLSKILPDYMLPGSLVALESFPLNTNGKIMRSALSEPHSNITSEYVAPATHAEIVVCRIWEEVLGLGRVGTTDDFFGIGGNSILAIQVSHRMSEALAIEVKVSDIFISKNINALLENVTSLKVNDNIIEKEF